MYDYIKGSVGSKSMLPNGNFITIEAFGIGYLFEVTSRDYSSLELGADNVKIYSVLIHREDKMSFCGFIKKEDRDIFNVLTSVSGVGTKMAVTLLDKFSASELIGNVIEGNYKELTLAKGVGTKIAQKIVLELKDKLINFQKETSTTTFVEKVRGDNSNFIDAQSVLMSLGYQKDEIKRVFAKINNENSQDITAEIILQDALKLLSCS